MMDFEELDETTRKWMLEEFNTEQAQEKHFEPKDMTAAGLREFPKRMRKAFESGTIESLTTDLADPSIWNDSTTQNRKGKIISITINPATWAKRLAHSEFTTLYTRGFARRLMEEGEKECQIYRADKAVEPKCECTNMEEEIVPIEKTYNGHRAKYFPNDNPTAFSIPSVAHCHHTIRRVKK